jgi:hypothetical protein
MKKTLLLFVFLVPFLLLQAQKYDPVTLMLAFQQKFAGITHFSGHVHWKRQNGEAFTGKFVVDGEKYQILWQDSEIRSDGKYEWEIMHRSKRIKKQFYDPLLAPAVVNVFRFVRLDLEAEVVRIGGTVDKIALDIDFGSSVAQGSHRLVIDLKTLDPKSLMLMVDQEGYYESAEFAEIKSGDNAKAGEFDLNFDDWKAKGYKLTDMAIGESTSVWPEERALK